jgi:hypothetical protein
MLLLAVWLKDTDLTLERPLQSAFIVYSADLTAFSINTTPPSFNHVSDILVNVTCHTSGPLQVVCTCCVCLMIDQIGFSMFVKESSFKPILSISVEPSEKAISRAFIRCSLFSASGLCLLHSIRIVLMCFCSKY